MDIIILQIINVLIATDIFSVDGKDALIMQAMSFYYGVAMLKCSRIVNNSE